MIERAELAERIASVRGRISAAAAACGRHERDILLIGVTKTHSPELAQAAVEAGVEDLGENRVQELVAKRDRVAHARWHLVGQLQRNKVRDVVGRQILVHSVDRRRLADTLSRHAQQRDAVQRVLIQVNVGDDPAKGGCEVEGTLDLVAYARQLPNLAVEGLMTIPPLPPASADPQEAAREHFVTLRSLRDEARTHFPEVVHLSMGMSADLESAIAEGATMIRIGTALFGSRQDGPWRPEEDAG